MNFALFTTTFFPIVGGAEKQLDLLARGLLARGHSPLVIAPWVSGKNNEIKTPYPIYRYPRIRSKRWGLRWHARFLSQLHKKHAFDWIHSQGAYPAGYMASAFAKRHSVPLIIRAYGGDVLPGEAIASSWWLNRRLKKTTASAKILIAQNHELKELLSQLSGNPNHVFQLANGVEIELYAKEILPNPYCDEAPFALTLSNFYPKKGLDILIRAWAQVVKQLPQAKLKIAGHGPDEIKLKNLIHELCVDDVVTIHGQVRSEDKIQLLQASQLYISSARREPFSNALLEAIAAGNRVVATRTGGSIEIVQKTQSGVLVEPSDETALANAIIQSFPQARPLLTFEQRYERIACYSVEAMIDNYLALLK
ncbi:MAG: glycosyltransferase family 4 protein [Verrucomicrobiae bacterium]|nr:glycosyltransferase family 4 protein [Verrucomicrobiae bacterium]